MNILTIFILLVLKLFVEANEFNLNFQQHDYEIKFERVELIRYNKAILKSAAIKTFKYNRTLAVINATFTPKIDLGNHLESTMQAYKFMSNEYRQFPIRFAANTCKAIVANMGGIVTEAMKCGNLTGCPYLRGRTYHMCNWHPDQSKLPPYIPSGQYMVEMEMLHFSAEVLVVNAYATVFRPFV